MEVTKRKRLCTNAIQPETLGNGFLFAVFFVQIRVSLRSVNWAQVKATPPRTILEIRISEIRFQDF